MALEPATPESVGMAPERIGWVRELIAGHVESGGTPSAAIVVARHGRTVMAEAFGVRGPHGDPLTLDSVWPLASACKPMTAAVVLSLVEDGLVGINDPVVEYLPELTGPGDDEVLVHHLLTHTAGWESAMRTHRLQRLFAEGAISEPPPGRDPITHSLLTMAFDPIRVAEPGAQMEYDNSHTELLAEIVRRLTGGTLDASMRARLFDPLGMTRSAVIVDDRLRPDLVTRAEGVPFGPGDLLQFQGSVWEATDSGASGVHMSALDLARFGQAILGGGELDGGRVLSPSSVQAMVTNQIPGTPAVLGPGEIIPEGSWGYGFTVAQERPFAYFRGGLVPLGSALHPGAGGMSYWIDFANEIVGVFFEVITEIDEFLVPISGIGQRVQDVVTAAVAA